MSWTTKILLAVTGAHFLLLAALIFHRAPRARRFEISRVATVDLVDPMEAAIAPEAEEPQPPPPPPEDPPEPPPEPPREDPPPRPEPERPPPPRRVTRRVEAPPPEPDLRRRLTERLSEIRTETPRAAAPERRSAVSGDETFPFGWYEDYLVRRLYELWDQPGRAVVREDQASAMISFRIHRDGRIEGVSVKRSSGSGQLDRSALDAVRRADPLPPLPEGFRGPWRDVNILFELTD